MYQNQNVRESCLSAPRDQSLAELSGTRLSCLLCANFLILLICLLQNGMCNSETVLDYPLHSDPHPHAAGKLTSESDNVCVCERENEKERDLTRNCTIVNPTLHTHTRACTHTHKANKILGFLKVQRTSRC